MIWGLYAAPKAKRRASGAALVAVKIVVLGGAAAALVAADRPVLGAALGIAALLDLTLLRRVAPDEPIPA